MNGVNQIRTCDVINTQVQYMLNMFKQTQGVRKILICTVKIDDYVQDINSFWHCLTIDEQKKTLAFKSKKLVQQYIITRGILRCILSFYMGVPARTIQLLYNKYGKPFVLNQGIYFNITHSRSVIKFAISPDSKVGIDLEYSNKHLNFSNIGDLVFSRQEHKLFKILPKKQCISFFYDIWTRKEALTKAFGMGLSYPLHNLTVMSDDDNIKIIINNRTWYLYKLKMLPEYFCGHLATEKKLDKIVYC